MAKKLKLQTPKGMHDILPVDQTYWQYIIRAFEEMSVLSGYGKIDTPMIESIDLFKHTSGESSDIVTKEMFQLDKKTDADTVYVLRPEFTASIVRAYVQNGLKTMPKPIKFYTHGPVFRYNKPQAGRLRQFHQLNLEQFGAASADIDAEMISFVYQLFNRLGVKNYELHINTIGDAKSRQQFSALLKNFFSPLKSKLCPDCVDRINKNPLRLLDCKQKSCQKLMANAPQIIDHIDDASKKHFSEVLEYLDELEIPYVLDSKLVRGLDYYTRTVFEFISQEDGLTLGAGGRYDDLLAMFGEESTPAVGVGIGIERLILNLQQNKVTLPSLKIIPDVFLIQLGDSAKKKCFKLLHILRSTNLKVSSSLSRTSISSQLKIANKQRARFAVIIGQKEALDNTVIIRDMKTGVQDTIDWENAITEIQKRLG